MAEVWIGHGATELCWQVTSASEIRRTSSIRVSASSEALGGGALQRSGGVRKSSAEVNSSVAVSAD